MKRDIRIRFASGGADEHFIWTLLKDNDLDRDNFNINDFFVAENGPLGMFLGCARMRNLGDTLELASVAVMPGERGKGVGSKLVQNIIKWARYVPIHLICEPKEVWFFKRFGFEVTQEIPDSLLPKLKQYEEKCEEICVMRLESNTQKLSGASAHPWPEQRRKADD